MPKRYVQQKFALGMPALVSVLCALLLLGARTSQAQIALPYTENFGGITAANALPTVTGGTWDRSGTNAEQPSYAAAQATGNRASRTSTDAGFITFAGAQSGTGNSNVYTVGPFALTGGITYRTGIYYITDGTNGFGPLQLTYGPGPAGSIAGQTNVIATVPPNVIANAYTRLGGFFTPATSGNYYIAVKVQTVGTSTPGFLSLDDFDMVALPLCSGSPNPGNTIASATTVCPTTNIRLSLQNTIFNSGIQVQWQSSANSGGPFADITGATDTVLNTTQSVATFYRARVTCTAPGGGQTLSTPIQVNMSALASCYCTPAATATTYFINNFQTYGATTNITSLGTGAGTTSAGYSNFLSQTASAYQGNTVNFVASFGASATDVFGFSVFVDWNQNGAFEAGEKVYNSTASATSVAGNFTVPAGALTGNTRMRIRAEYNINVGPDACGTVTNSEAEDYTLNVLSLLPCTGVPTPGRIVTYSNIPVTGFSSDVIANGSGAISASTTADFDGAGNYLLDSTFQISAYSPLPQFALPVSGVINSTTTPGLNFKLASATGNNSVRMAAAASTGKLTFTTPTAVDTLYLLAASGGAASTINVSVSFSSGLPEAINGIVIPEYYNGANAAIAGIGRVNATNVQDGTGVNPRLYQIAIPISAANRGTTITEINFTKPAATGVANIMAVSGKTPVPNAVCAGTPGRVLSMPYIRSTTNLTFQWQESTTQGGPYTDIVGETNTTYTTPATATTTKYYVLKLICPTSTQSSITNEIKVEVLANPTVAIAASPASSNVCSGAKVTLTASGTGSSYRWYPVAGLSSSTVAAPDATPTSAQFYYVVSTAANGCTAIASKGVGVYTNPTLKATVSNATICAGGSTNLQVTDSNFGVAAQIGTYTNGTVTTPLTDEDLGNVTFGALNNTSTCGSLTGTAGTATGTGGGYSDFTGITPRNYVTGLSYPLSVGVLDCNTASKANAVAVYIDYNMNGVFTDPGEQVFASTATGTGARTLTSNVTIPFTARLGVTRMRVIVNQGGLVTGPQMSPANGEIEDYLVRIIRASIIPTANLTWTPAATLTPTTGTSVTSTGLTATTTFTVTGRDSNNCSSTATVTVNVNALPTITIAPTATTSICAGGSATLTASGATSYTWSPNTAITTTTGPTVTVSPTAALTYTVTGTDANGCQNTATRRITIDTLPVITITPSTTAFCFNTATVLTAGGAGVGGGGANGTYTWATDPNITLTTANTATVQALGATTITVTGTNGKGCVGTASRSITVNPLPTLTITPSAITTICAGDSVNLTVAGASTYSWSPATALNTTSGATVKAGPTTTTAISVTGTDANGCVSTTSKTIYVNQLPTVTITPATTAICAGSSVALTAAVPTGWPATTYAWTPVTGLTPPTGVGATVTAAPTATTTYTVTGTDANGCKGSATRLITVNPLPTVAITVTGSASVCSGDSATLTASGAATYAWTPVTGVGNTSAATTKIAPAATTTYTVTGTDANGCVKTATQVVTVRTRPNVTTGPATLAAICAGATAKIWSQSTTTGTTFAWTPATGLNVTTGDTVLATPAATTTYTVTATGTNGCTSTATKVVNVNALPAVAIAPTPAAVCIGSSRTLTASGATSYVWTASPTLTGTGATVTVNPTVNTTYTVTGTDANGCVNTATKNVVVNPLPILTISPTTTSVVCSNSPITLTASGASTYSWSPAATLNTSTGATVIASPVNTSTATPAVQTSTVYTVTGTDANGCVSTTTKTVFVNPLPVISVSPTTPVGVCGGAGAVLTASGAVTYTWTPPVGLSGTNTATVTATPSTTTTYTVLGTDGNGCTNVAQKTVTVNPLPVVAINSSNGGVICEGTNTILTASGAATYTWTPAGSLSSPTGTSVTATPTATTTYTVTGTTAAGCVGTASRTITVLPKPDASITPTGTITICQGDTVTLNGIPGATSYSWRIYGTPIAAATGVTYRTFIGGFYTLRVTGSNGCVDTTLNPTIINVIQAPVPAILRNGNTLSTDAPFASYQWYLNGAPITGATTQFYNVTQDGFYTVAVTSASTSCRGISAAYNFTGSGVGVPGTAGIDVKIYPNPSSDELHVEAPVKVAISVVSMDGKTVYQSDKKDAINVRNWADGVYRVVVRNADGAVLKMEKITKISR
jgi:hypothetical protein